MGFRIVDEDGLAAELHRLSHLRFDAVILKNMAQIYNRGKADGGTPVDTGELRLSLSHEGDTVGYAKSYAPHVEYGHRLVGGGYVEGQRFLKRNVDAQRPIFAEDLRRQLRRF
ncbi:HK97 gp10 family phage protein [Coriobacteriales bacterium OH1046]|nr:HK97 gp10 family phage protein [Coriobacteriales bacterium OH1046]